MQAALSCVTVTADIHARRMAKPQMINVLVQYLSPALIGGLAGFGTFYFQWDVEKRRAKLARRAALVDSWRQTLLDDWEGGEGIYAVPPEGMGVTRRPAYASLRPHLSELLKRDLEGADVEPGTFNAPITVHVAGTKSLRTRLISEIGKVEAAWGLV